MLENKKEQFPFVPVMSEPQSRRERKKARTRQEIYTAAMTLFLHRGFDVVSIEDICTAADVAKGTFFLHFPTKDALLLEYGAQVTAELTGLFRQSRGSATSALTKMLGFLAARATHHADIVRLVVREVMARPVALVDATEQSRDLSSLFAEVVRSGQDSGEFRRQVSPRVAAAILISTYLAVVTEWVRRGGNFAITQVLKQSIDVVLHGLAKKSE